MKRRGSDYSCFVYIPHFCIIVRILARIDMPTKNIHEMQRRKTMSTLKKNRRITAILYAILIIVVVSVFCISLFSTAIGDKKEKSAAPKATEQATRPITVTEKIPDLSSGSDAALPAQTEPAATEPEAPAEPTVSLVPTYSMPIVGGTVSKTFSDSVATYSQTMNDYRVHTGIDIYAPAVSYTHLTLPTILLV